VLDGSISVAGEKKSAQLALRHHLTTEDSSNFLRNTVQ
jgi:hypothetical protein